MTDEVWMCKIGKFSCGRFSHKSFANAVLQNLSLPWKKVFTETLRKSDFMAFQKLNYSECSTFKELNQVRLQEPFRKLCKSPLKKETAHSFLNLKKVYLTLKNDKRSEHLSIINVIQMAIMKRSICINCAYHGCVAQFEIIFSWQEET